MVVNDVAEVNIDSEVGSIFDLHVNASVLQQTSAGLEV